MYSDPANKLFGVFDGHGGEACSDYIADRLPSFLKTELVRNKNYKEAVTQVFESMDSRFLASGYASKAAVLGSCGIVSFIRNDIIYTASVGDSRSVLGRRQDGKVQPVRLNEDHNSKNESERAALSKRTTDPHPFRAGPADNSDGDRVGGVIMVTRAFGDGAFKTKDLSYPPFVDHLPYLTCEPEVTEHQMTDGDEFMVVSSDGLYDFLNVDQVVQYTSEYIEANKNDEEKLMKVSEHLAQKVLEAASTQLGITIPELIEPTPERKKRMDDTSIIVVFFGKNASSVPEERFDNELILVTGPSGEIGRRIVRELSEIKGSKIKALTKSPNAIRWPSNVQEVEIDPNDKDSVLPACAGAAISIIIPPLWSSISALTHMYTFGMTAQKVPAAKHVIKVGQLHSANDAKPLVLKMHSWADNQLRKAPVPFTLVKPNMYMQGFYKYWGKSIRETGNFYVLNKATKVSFIDARDISSAVTVIALDTEAHDQKEYNLTGAALSYEEVAAILTKALGKTVNAVEVGADDLKAKLLDSFPCEQFVATALLDLWKDEVESNKAGTVYDDFEKVVGRKPLTFEQFATDHKARFLGTFVDPEAVQRQISESEAALSGASVAAGANVKPPDFTGTWELDLKLSDKFGPILEELGVGFMERTFMSGAKTKMIYTQDEKTISCKVPTPVGASVEVFLLDGTKETRKAGMPIPGNCLTWTAWTPDKKVLVSTYEVNNSSTTGTLIIGRRLLDDKTMEMSLKYHSNKKNKDTFNKRVFTKIA